MKRPKQVERITLAITLPRDGEEVTRKDLEEYILKACRDYWAWAERMKWKIEKAYDHHRR